MNVLTTDSLSAIQAKLNALPAGGTLQFPSMTMPSGTLVGKDGITLLAVGKVLLRQVVNFDGKTGWTVRGSTPSPQTGFVFAGDWRLSAQGASNFAVGNCGFNNITAPPNWWNGTAIAMNGARTALIVNNSFLRCQGNVVGMYDIDKVTFDGNHFTDCWQPFSIQMPNTAVTTLGRDLVWRRNTFIGTQRACIEVGPNSSGAEYFSGIVVEDNFFDDFDCKCTPGEMLPISLVGQAAQNTTVRNNYIRKGSRAGVNTPAFEWTVGTEFTGSGECTGNTICGFRYNLLYKSGWNVHDNILYGTPDNFSINQAGATGIMSNNVIVATAPVPPPKPTRVAW